MTPWRIYHAGIVMVAALLLAFFMMWLVVSFG